MLAAAALIQAKGTSGPITSVRQLTPIEFRPLTVLPEKANVEKSRHAHSTVSRLFFSFKYETSWFARKPTRSPSNQLGGVFNKTL